MIGTNNIERDKPEDMIEGVKKIIDILKSSLPQVNVYILAIPPRTSWSKISNADLIIKIRSYNQLLSLLGEKYIDIYSSFTDADEQMNNDLFTDGVHFNDVGYNLYAKLLNPFLNE